MLASAVVSANARRKKNSKHSSSANSDESHSSSYSTEQQQQQQQMNPISHQAAGCDESMIGEAKKRLDQRLQSRLKSETNRPTSDIEQISKMSEDKPSIQQEAEMVEIKVETI